MLFAHDQQDFVLDQSIVMVENLSAIRQKQPFGPAPESGHSYSFPDPENCPQVSVILELLYGQSEFRVTVRFE